MIVAHALWLPVLLSAVLVFVASSIIHTVLPWHKGDYRRIPNEDEARAAIGALKIPPGDYVIPRPLSAKDMRTPEFAEKMAKGPVMIITVRPNGPATMGKTLVIWFLYCAVVGAFAACLAALTLSRGADSHDVIHVVGLTTFIGYSLALWQLSIWYSRAWSTTAKATLDSLIYAVLTAATFAWLWPR